ncbi:MAG: hypothetical protein JWQ02_2933 [Capsulimonas sp.]|nr:hypothetical protein [Capsulimonas sp.]
MAFKTRFSLGVALAMALGACLYADTARAQTAAPPLRCLIVGGGPDKDYNQVAIESNVRYVQRLLPAGTKRRILFTNGSLTAANVQYEDRRGRERFRPTLLKNIDGPARYATFQKTFEGLAADPKGPLLLYFTGHGSPDDDGSFANNAYDMWGNDLLTVDTLSDALDAAPTSSTPTVLVMAQCFSGAFADTMFRAASAKGPALRPNFCGFFASISVRPAAGCTPEVNEANYHDFTSYFFGALSGRDRLGKPVTSADYDHDGRVGMNEAFAYSLIHDISIDTPVATSDVFVRRYVKTPEPTIFRTPYSDVLKWSTPAQAAALEGLSKQLELRGELRLMTAYRTSKQRGEETPDEDAPEEEDVLTARWIRIVRLAKTVVLAHTLTTGPNESLKTQYASLIQSEAANPIAPKIP